MSEASDPRLCHAHVARNRAPILEVLSRVLPVQGLVLGLASGSGEHAVFFANGLPTRSWQPTDLDRQRTCEHRRSPRHPLMHPICLRRNFPIGLTVGMPLRATRNSTLGCDCTDAGK